jgi:hypothetical protein
LLLQRAVIDAELDADRTIRPRAGAAWRSEPARGEAAVHRRLAALAAKPDARIPSFASVHGPLRRLPHAILAAPRHRTAAALVAVGQEALDESARAQEWFEGGARGEPPPGTEDTLATVVLYAHLPAQIHDTFDRYAAGEEASSSDPAVDFFTPALRTALVAARAAPELMSNPGFIRTLDPAVVRRAFRLLEWHNRVLGGLEEVPGSLADVGGADGFMRQLVVAIPELFPADDALAADPGALTIGETVDEWRAAATELGALVRRLDLVRGALGPVGLAGPAKRELLAAYADLAGFRPTVDLAASEIAERARPFLLSSMEDELARLDAWPVRRGGLVGLYARALLAAWAELAAASPPTACTIPGCANTMPSTRNRLYCDSCKTERRTAGVRDIRARGTVAG